MENYQENSKTPFTLADFERCLIAFTSEDGSGRWTEIPEEFWNFDPTSDPPGPYREPESLPEIRVDRAEYDGRALTLDIEASEDCPKYPFALWTGLPAPRGAAGLRGGFFIFVSLKKGPNRIRREAD